MNRVILIGRFTRDPESRMSGNSTEVSRFSLACQNDFVSRDGERSAEFINCVAFGRTAGTINRYCKKGAMVSITGRIRNSSYDAQDGSKRYTTDVVVENFEFLSSRSNASTSGYGNDNNLETGYTGMPSYTNNIETTDISEDPYKDFGEEVTISSDDLPF